MRKSDGLDGITEEFIKKGGEVVEDISMVLEKTNRFERVCEKELNVGKYTYGGLTSKIYTRYFEFECLGSII